MCDQVLDRGGLHLEATLTGDEVASLILHCGDILVVRSTNAGQGAWAAEGPLVTGLPDHGDEALRLAVRPAALGVDGVGVFSPEQ